MEYAKLYYFKVSAVNEGGESTSSEAVRELCVGPAGGYVFYDKGYYSDSWRYLEAAPVDLTGTYDWGAYEKNVSDTQADVGSGKPNTKIIVSYLNSINETGKAAQAATAYSYNGYSDWFLPSKDELNLMHQNLKRKWIGGFSDAWYWSSSQYDTNHAWGQNFDYGFQYSASKNHADSVRMVRAF